MEVGWGGGVESKHCLNTALTFLNHLHNLHQLLLFQPLHRNPRAIKLTLRTALNEGIADHVDGGEGGHADVHVGGAGAFGEGEDYVVEEAGYAGGYGAVGDEGAEGLGGGGGERSELLEFGEEGDV